MTEKDLAIYQGKYFQHLHNVWLGAVKKYLAKYLEQHMKNYLALIRYHLCVACTLDELSWQVYKEYNVTCNNPKGRDYEYSDLEDDRHPGKI